MRKPAVKASDPIEAVRRVARQFPEVEEGVSCNKCAFKARGKAFLFLGQDAAGYNLMLKLGDSLPVAARLEAKFPRNFAVGGHNWVELTFAHGESAPAGVLEKWIAESYALLAPKSLAARLIESAPQNAPTKRAKATRR